MRKRINSKGAINTLEILIIAAILGSVLLAAVVWGIIPALRNNAADIEDGIAYVIVNEPINRFPED